MVPSMAFDNEETNFTKVIYKYLKNVEIGSIVFSHLAK